jgi:hypothetical protein
MRSSSGRVGEVDRDGRIAKPVDRGELQVPVLAHRVEIGCGNALDQVEPARLQIGEAHG